MIMPKITEANSLNELPPLVPCIAHDDVQHDSTSEFVVAEKTARRPKRQTIAIVASLIYANFWTAACVSLQAPFFPNEAEKKGASATEYGFVFGIFELIVMFLSPVFGRLIPRISPKIMSTTGVFVEGAACAAFGILDIIPPGKAYITMAFIVRIVEGLGAAAVVIASFTIIAFEFQESIGTTFSFLETAFGLGIIAGPTIGGALYELGGFMLPFAVCGGLLLLGSIFFAVLLPTNEECESLPPRDFCAFIQHVKTVMHAMTFVITLMVLGFNSATLEPHLRQFKLRPVIIGATFIASGGVYAVTTPIFGRICDKGVDPCFMGIFGHISVCLGLLFIGPVSFLPIKTSLWLIVVSLVAVGLGVSSQIVSTFSGLLKDTISRGLPNNIATYSMVSALFSTTSAAGSFIGPSLGGCMLDSLGYRKSTTVMFSIEACFLIIILIFHCVQKYRASKRNSEESPLLLREN